MIKINDLKLVFVDTEFPRTTRGGRASTQIMEIPGGGKSTMNPCGIEKPGVGGVGSQTGAWIFSGSPHIGKNICLIEDVMNTQSCMVYREIPTRKGICNMPFFPLAPCSTAFLLGHAQKSKFLFWHISLFPFPFFSFCCSD